MNMDKEVTASALTAVLRGDTLTSYAEYVIRFLHHRDLYFKLPAFKRVYGNRAAKECVCKLNRQIHQQIIPFFFIDGMRFNADHFTAVDSCRNRDVDLFFAALNAMTTTFWALLFRDLTEAVAGWASAYAR